MGVLTINNKKIGVDNCLNSTRGTLMEYYCNSNSTNNYLFYDCPNGCRDGACISNTQTCTDSDGGIDYYVKGTLKIGNEAKTDQCLNSTKGTLMEYYCGSNTTTDYLLYDCPYGCLNGACSKNNPSCSDSDGGRDYYVMGKTTAYFFGSTTLSKRIDSCEIKGNNITSSSCSGSNCYVEENYITNDCKGQIEEFECVYGCSNGACYSYDPGASNNTQGSNMTN
jgi:hypothetical protein